MHRTKTLIATLTLLTTTLALAAGPAAAQAPAFDSGNLASGDSFTWTPQETGAYGYHCTYHGSMSGTITVIDGVPGEDVEIQIEGFDYHPANVTVTTGTTITWINLDESSHTVTADDDAGSMEGNGSMEADDNTMDGDGGMMADDSMSGDGGTQDAPGPGLVGLAAGISLAALLVARRRP